MNDARTVTYYRERAAEYEQIYYRHQPDRRREIDDEADRLKSYAAGRDVLELACGTGYWSRIMAQTARRITAVDIWQEMLNEARKKQYRSPVDFVRGDMDRLPVKAHAFDFIAVGFWFSHQPRQLYNRFYENLKQPLRPGGKVWMIDNNPPAEGRFKESDHIDEHGNNYKKRFLNDGREYVILKNYFEKDELKTVFEPVFHLEKIVYERFYWSVLLTFRDR
ncbi:MAG: class I SAM-dependent methyltransferase [Candidatus Zixiibacteriota bacterium]